MAFSVFVPAVGKMREQPPAATVPVHVSPAPSLTVTLPVGVPLPSDTVATAKLTATACPAKDGFGAWAPMEVVVLALFTVWARAVDVLPAKVLFPA